MSAPTLSGIRFGAAYYLEYQPDPTLLDRDLDWMREAGFTVIRVGESVWSTWEPRNGEFDLDWLQPVLDGAHRRGIAVTLGTPTYAAPPWLARQYPGIAGETRTGQPHPWGARQEIDYTHPAFLFHAERVIRAVVGRYAEHPAVVGYQVDNEPGLLLLHNRGTFLRFVEHLKDVYGDVETLNREWGLTYWSHRLSDWAELWTPDGNAQPQYDLAWRRFQAQCTSDFIAWQAGIVREYARPGQYVTTCIAASRPALNDMDLARSLDVAATNPYFEVQDHLDRTVDRDRPAAWMSTGAWGLLEYGDRGFAAKQQRFLVTETNAQTIHGSHHNYPPYPGQLTQAAFALIARGAAQIEYWHWHTLHYGTETYWGGVLPHSQRRGRIYREVAGIGGRLAAIGDRLDDYRPDADVLILYSHDSKFAMDFQPPFNIDGVPDRQSYSRLFDAFYRGIVDAGAQARLVHAEQFRSQDPGHWLDIAPTLVVPGLYVATDAELDALRRYAELGGHLVVGPRTGYGDQEARARLAVAPDRLHDAAGVWYEEFTDLDEPLWVSGENGFDPGGGQACSWADGLIPDGAEVLARYDHPHHGRFPVITSTTHGAGRITYVGTIPDPTLAAAVLTYAVPARKAEAWQIDSSGPLTVASGTVPDASGELRRRVWFVHNWGPEPAPLIVPYAVVDLVDGTSYAPATDLKLEPWSCMVLADV